MFLFNMAANMYRVGDYVYFETSVSEPYQVKRIEELTKTQAGSVEARVRCFYRRSDLSASLIKQAERCYGLAWEGEAESDTKTTTTAAADHSKSAKNECGVNGESDVAGEESESTDVDDDADNAVHSRLNGSRDEATERPDADAVADRSSPQRDTTTTTDKSAVNKPVSKSDPTAAPGAVASVNGSWMQQLSVADRQKLLEHRELFLSRTVDTLPATQIRGKCSVTLLCEQAETAENYLSRPDRFFYSLVYDPVQKTLRVDEGEMRVGTDYQADVPAWTGAPSPRPPKRPRRGSGHDTENGDTLMWRPDCGGLSDEQVKSFVTLARSVGLFARCLESSGGENGSAHGGVQREAAAASRDITHQHALDTLHRSDYDVAEALATLVPAQSGPTLCRDELEQWSPAESAAFDRGYDEHGKQFGDLRCQLLPWKSHASVIEYFYMWKASERFVRRRRAKLMANESQLKQVYIPDYPDSGRLASSTAQCNGASSGNSTAEDSPRCDGCGQQNHGSRTSCGEWRLCTECHHYWKRYGSAPLPGYPGVQYHLPPASAVQRSLLQTRDAVASPLSSSSSSCSSRVRAGFLMRPSWLALTARYHCLGRRVWRRFARRGLAPLLTVGVPSSTSPIALAAGIGPQTVAAVRRRCATVDSAAITARHLQRHRRVRAQLKLANAARRRPNANTQQCDLPASSRNGHAAPPLSHSVSITLVPAPSGGSQPSRRRVRRCATAGVYDGTVFVARSTLKQLRAACSIRQLHQLARAPCRPAARQLLQLLSSKLS